MNTYSGVREITKAKFLQSVDSYIELCRRTDRIPNRAGYRRHMKMTNAVYNGLCARYPDTAELICAAFEDEALNANTKKVSASVLNLYLKKCFGYADAEEDGGGVSVICAHPDGEDE